MATATVYASAGDGLVRRYGAAWATIRAASTGDDVAATSTGDYGVWAEHSNPGIGRSFYPFDTGTALADNVDVSAASLFVYVTAASGAAGGSFMVVSSTQASTSTLATTDFGSVGSTEYSSRVNFSGLATSAYLEIPLNAAGIAAVSKTGFTKLALRSSFDLDNSGPSGATSQMQVKFSEQTGTSNDPYLLVTYSFPSRTTSDAWAWTDSNTVTGGGGTLITQPRTTGDTWAWSDACTEYWRASRQPVLVRAAGANTTLSGAQTANSGTITVASTTGFASSGTAMIIDTADTTTPYKQSLFNYTGKTGTTFTGCTGGEALSFADGVSVSANDAENAFPCIVPLSTGARPRLLAVYNQHAAHSAMKGGLSKGKISSDGGRTWGSEFTAGPARVNDSTYGTGLVSVIRLKNGRLLGFVFEQTWASWPTLVWKCYLSYSDDDGTTWSTPSAQLADPFGTNACVPGFSPILYTGSGSNSTYGDVYIPVYGITSGLYSGKYYSQLQKVTDGGAGGTWSNVSVLATPSNCGNASVNEAGVLALENGTWIAHIRGEADGTSGVRDTWQATSTDLGVTWSGHTLMFSNKINQPSIAQMPESHIIAQGLSGTTGYLTTWISTNGGTSFPFSRSEPYPSVTYQNYVGTNQAVIADTSVPGRRMANVFAFETTAQDAAQVYFQWYSVENFPLTTDTWAWSDSAAVTNRGYVNAASDSWAWSDSASRTLGRGRGTSDAWAWSDGVDTAVARGASDAWAWSDTASRSAQSFSRAVSNTWTWSESASASTGPLVDTWSWSDIATVTTSITGASGQSGFTITSALGAEVTMVGVVDASLTFTAVV